MNFPTSLPESYPWRKTAIVASAVAAFELILLVMIVLAFLGKPIADDFGDRAKTSLTRSQSAAETTAAPAAKKKSPPPTPRAKLSREETSVLVLNGNGASGAASEKADLVQTKSYIIAGTANAPRTDFTESVVMFRPGYRAEADRFAKDFGIKRVSPLDGLSPSDLQGAHVVLIVGEN
jgi:LytR cell envelope-related transcriptional attenuator